MGNTYEVYAWVKGETLYYDKIVYQGESLVKALLAARKAKKTSGRVKLEWR